MRPITAGPSVGGGVAVSVAASIVGAGASARETSCVLASDPGLVAGAQAMSATVENKKPSDDFMC
jgi:hypothetical protein